MKRVVRIAVALSLILAVGTGVLWWSTYSGGKALVLTRADEERGGIWLRTVGLGMREGVVRLLMVRVLYSREEWDRSDRRADTGLPRIGDGWLLVVNQEDPGINYGCTQMHADRSSAASA